MNDSFRAFRIHQQDRGVRAGLESLRLEQLTAGEVVIRVTHSGINYKDALAATGAGRILRRPALVGGIDLAGTVVEGGGFAAGAPVLVTGCGLSETLDGGYAEYARVPASAVVAMPPGLDAPAAMAIGTAGYAAALAIMRMEQNGQRPEHGPIVVTGATGGVGSLAIDMLAGLGYEVIALTGKAEAEPYLRALGAQRLLVRGQFDLGTRALEAASFAGAIDNVGGEVLSWLLRSTREDGNVASVGLAASADLSLTVMPFILRGVNLLGVHSASADRATYVRAWSRLASDLRPRHLARIAPHRVRLEALAAAFAPYIDGRVVGRTVVEIA